MAIVPLGCASPPAGEPISAVGPEKNILTTPPQEVTAEPAPLRDEELLAHRPPPPPPAPIDPGAAHVVENIARVLHTGQPAGDDRVTRIAVSKIRNHSRCQSGEFQLMLDRLASQLTHAGRTHHLSFTNDAAADVQYHLHGTAYLITAEGFDLWEMFLALSPSGSDWTIWNAPGPVNILRQMRPGQPQILLGLQW